MFIIINKYCNSLGSEERMRAFLLSLYGRCNSCQVHWLDFTYAQKKNPSGQFAKLFLCDWRCVLYTQFIKQIVGYLREWEHKLDKYIFCWAIDSSYKSSISTYNRSATFLNKMYISIFLIQQWILKVLCSKFFMEPNRLK